MSAIVVIGGQWGDEGKGRIVDLLAQKAHIVARYSAGNNAGHTIINELGEFKLHLVPAGIFYRDKLCIIGNGCVVDPEELLNEIEHLVETVVEAADTISEEFFVIINGKQAGKKASGAKIEASLRKTYTALSEFSRKASDATRKHAEKLVTKLKRQLEVVIAGIIEFVTLSLDRIMQKQDIEELKRRQERIAFMLHSMSQQPST